MHSFATFSNLNFFVKNRQIAFAIELMNFINSIAKNSNFASFLRIFDEFFSGFRAKFQKIVTCVAFSIKFAKTNQKFAENSEFCENYSLLFKIIHWCPLAGKSGSVIVCSRGVEVPAPGLSRRHLPPCGREGSQLINSFSAFGGLQIIRHHRRKLKCSQPTDFEQNHQWSQAMHYAF